MELVAFIGLGEVNNVFSHVSLVGMSDCCLQGIEPCECKRKGHQWIGNQILDD